MTRIAVVGATGFVGGAIARAAAARPDLRVEPVGREEYEAARTDGPWDVVVHAAMPSRRYWARMNPREDFEATVARTARLVHDWEWGKLVLVGTISARSRPDTVYGRHKAAAEALVAGAGNLIVRLGPMYGEALDKGVLIDMRDDRPVYVDGESRYGFAPLEWVAGWIVENLERSGVVEVTGRDAPPLREVAAAVGSRSTFEGPLDHQEADPPLPDAPPAADAIGWLDRARAGVAG